MALSYAGSGGSLLFSSATQLVVFAVLARSLGADQFALYITIMAFTNVAVQICGLGAHETLVRRIAQDPADYPRLMGHALLLTFGTAALLVLVGLIALPIFVPVSPNLFVNLGTIALLLLSTVVIQRLVSMATSAYVARSNFTVANGVEVAFGITRLTAALLGCLVFGATTVAEWAVWFFAAHAVVALLAIHLIWRMGRPRYEIVREEIKIGALFSTQFIFKAIRQNTDIVLLGMFTSAEIVSSYGVARRVLDSSYLSIEALNRLIYPGSAVAFASGFHNALGRIRKVMGAGLGISILAAIAVYVLAPLMPILFGDEYSSMVGFTQILCWLVIPGSLSSMALDAFGAAGRQDVRALVYNTANILAAGVLAVACAVAGVNGVFVSGYAIEILTAIVACLLLLRFIRTDRDRALHTAPAE